MHHDRQVTVGGEESGDVLAANEVAVGAVERGTQHVGRRDPRPLVVDQRRFASRSCRPCGTPALARVATGGSRKLLSLIVIFTVLAPPCRAGGGPWRKTRSTTVKLLLGNDLRSLVDLVDLMSTPSRIYTHTYVRWYLPPRIG